VFLKNNYKIYFSVFLFFTILLLSNIVYGYSDSALTDIVLSNTVKAGPDLNVNFIISGDTGVDVDVNIYAPSGTQVYSGTLTNLSSGENLDTLSIPGDLNQSSQPYLIRGFITTTDDNPSNNLYSKYFTVTRSNNKVPVSDIPMFSGILVALVALFFISSRNNKVSKKQKK